MNEEKIMILKMLEEGKIDSKEAVELIEALDRKDKSKQSAEGFIDSKKVTETLEGLGSTITDTVLNLVEGFKNIDFSSSLSGNYESEDKNITESISNIDNPIVDFSSINGFIDVSSVESENIMIKVESKYKPEKVSTIDELFNFTIEDNLIKFEPTQKARNNAVLNLNVLLPKKKYKNIILSSTNGGIKIKELESDFIKINTTNGNINSNSMKVNEATLCSTNGRISVEDIIGRKLDILTSNGKIKVYDANEKFIYTKTTNASIEGVNILADNFIASTTNGRIKTENIDCSILDLDTSNGSVKTILGESNKSGKYDLSTSFGNISLNREGLVYHIENTDKNTYKKISAEDKDYKDSKDKIDVKINTTHGSITVN